MMIQFYSKCLLFCLLVGMVSHEVVAQNRQTIKGQVLNATDRTPIGGATMSVVGGTAKTKTDAKGNFRLQVNHNRPQTQIMVKALGFKPKGVFVGKAETAPVTILLQEESIDLDEVVVVGYGTQKRSDLTGSISSIKSEEIDQARSPELMSSLQGKVAGVRIFSQSGEPGAAMNVQIRGISSLYGSSSPLFVIDGIQYDVNDSEVATSDMANLGNSSNPLAMLNPADIESIEVLKDASATAIYGSRGANGVVMITTKSGKSGRSATTYDAYVKFSSASKKIDMLNGNEFIDYQKMVNPVSALFYNYDSEGNLDLNNPKDPYQIPQHDWQAEMMDPATSHNHNLSISGGTGKTNYWAGMGYLDEEGLVRKNGLKRYTMRMKINHEVNKKIKMGMNVNASYTDLNGAVNTGQANDWNGILQQTLTSKPISYFDSEYDETVGFVTPVSIIDNTYKNIGTLKAIGNGFIEAELTKNLKLNISAGGIISSSKGKEFYSRYTTMGNTNNGVGIIQERRSFNWYNTNQLTYQKEFDKNNRINVMAAFETNGYIFERSLMRNSNYPDEITGINDISKGAIVNGVVSNKWENNRLSWLGRANYVLYDKYLFTASFRADGSDKFGEGNKYGYFPSFAFAWHANKEEFLKNVRDISDLKLRLSYGQTGNERIPAYSYAGQMANAYYAADGISAYGLVPATLANPNLKWETTVQYNAGADIGLLQNRINFTVDAYYKQTKDMLLPTLIPSQSGYSQQWQNIGKIDNKGLEFQLNTKNVQSKDWTWETNLNISFNKNKIRSLGSLDYIPVVMDNGVITNLGRVSVGQELGTGYGYVANGVYQIDQFEWQNNSDPTIAHQDRNYTLKNGEVDVAGVAVLPGSFKFKDLNGDGIIDEDHDRTFISHSQPKYFGGMNNKLSYKNLELNFFFEWSYGAQIMNISSIALNGQNVNRNITKEFYDNRWTPDNPTNSYGDFRAINGLGGGNNTWKYASTYYVEDASYLRLRTVTLGYNLPKEWTQRVGLNRAKVYVTGDNLWLLTNYSGYDPDVSFSNPLFPGFDRISYPRARSFMVGINVNF